MVMAHVGSQFHHLEECMFEILVYRKMHRRCSLASSCWSASDSFKADVGKKMIRLLCVIHSVAAGFNISDHLCTNLCISLAVFKFHRVTFKWIWTVTSDAPVGTPSGFTHLRLASRCLSLQARSVVSCHLDPFLFPVLEGNVSWPDFVRNQLLEDNRDSLFTWWQNSHSWADRCYSMLFFYLHLTTTEMVTWQNCESYLSLCDKTIGLYDASSSATQMDDKLIIKGLSNLAMRPNELTGTTLVRITNTMVIIKDSNVAYQNKVSALLHHDASGGCLDATATKWENDLVNNAVQFFKMQLFQVALPREIQKVVAQHDQTTMTLDN
jgi:hypothetical protein